ncbi:DUF4236 domain-containing protein [Roseibacterium sp. SDUM158017]|uniref:DUF4236 domain-containing protein n=1 Tax=Roseicyclus salinarum TaxID=3036773 RepID=UPI002414E7F3|nr:DUF4236 domain-containing protein [Roseibacterium sp. SDUM158017]MDG4650441.1 DUF4236 domain-containing protein [Roseibacterium sp. SDUM158017]
MGWRFRRSIRIMPGVRLNVSKSGFSTTIGRRGASVNVSKRGIYGTAGIPGTGLSYRARLDQPAETKARSQKKLKQGMPDELHSPVGKQRAVKVGEIDTDVLNKTERPVAVNDAPSALKGWFSRGVRRRRVSFVLGSIAVWIVGLMIMAIAVVPVGQAELGTLQGWRLFLMLAGTAFLLAAQAALMIQRFRDIGAPGWGGAVSTLIIVGVLPAMALLAILLLSLWPSRNRSGL